MLASDDFLDTIEVRSFVVVNLSNYDKIPVIGKVLQINNDTVKIHYWKGSFKGKSLSRIYPGVGLLGWMSSQRAVLFYAHFP